MRRGRVSGRTTRLPVSERWKSKREDICTQSNEGAHVNDNRRKEYTASQPDHEALQQYQLPDLSSSISPSVPKPYSHHPPINTIRTLVAKLEANNESAPTTRHPHETLFIQCGHRRMNIITNGISAKLSAMATFPMEFMACSELLENGGWVR